MIVAYIDSVSENEMRIQIGNVAPLASFTLTVSFMQEMTVDFNTFFKVEVPALVLPNAVQLQQSIDSDFKVHLRTSRKISLFHSPSH